jgi:DMSO/TMAO reductase YedYZ molybdopterin-dependent catalytic subunit
MSRADTHTRPDTDTRTGTDDGTAVLTVLADERRRYDLAALRDLPRAERRCTVVCATGDRHTARWTGVSVTELLADADAPPETTHVRLESRDGYRVCVPIRDALDGIVADTKEGAPLAKRADYRTRFVAPGVDGERLVKGLRRLEALALAPDEDPDRLENVTVDAPEFG